MELIKKLRQAAEIGFEDRFAAADKLEKSIAKIDEITAACARESHKPFTGYVGSPREALALIRNILAD